jgi:hypothetical protein
LLNVALKTILSFLVKWEKHWTRSEEESAYAIQAFVSQLLNSVVVLLLVNARLDSVSEAINSGLDANKTSRWWVVGGGGVQSLWWCDQCKLGGVIRGVHHRTGWSTEWPRRWGLAKPKDK